MSARSQPIRDLYPSIEHAIPSSPMNFQAEDKNDELLTIKANIQVLQQGQVNQRLTLGNIERMLAQMLVREGTRDNLDRLEEDQEVEKKVREVSVSSFG